MINGIFELTAQIMLNQTRLMTQLMVHMMCVCHFIIPVKYVMNL